MNELIETRCIVCDDFLSAGVCSKGHSQIKRKYVLKGWLSELPLVMQATVLTGIRGSDQVRDDISKSVIRWMRRKIINNGRAGGKFVRDDKLPDEKEFGQAVEYTSMHFVSHLSHVLQIIAYKHPEVETRKIAMKYYVRLCEKMHCQPETENHMDIRLSDDSVVKEQDYV